MRRLRTFGGLICCLLACAGTVAAQPSDRAAAEALFRAGRDANARGDYATACRRFEESNRLEPAVGTVFNLANCREKLGQLASAWQRYQEVVQKLPPGDERTAIASQRAAALEARLPKLVLNLPTGAPPGTLILKDGVELGTGSLGVELPVDPGEHELVVRAEGHLDAKHSVTLKEGEKREVKLELGEPKPAAPSSKATDSTTFAPLAPAEQDRGSSSSQRTIGFVVGGVGIAGLVVSGITGAMVISKKHTVDDECSNKHCTTDGLDAADSGRALSTVSTVAFVAGAAALGTGIVLVLTGKNQETSGATLSATATPGFGGLRFGGRF